MRQRKIKDIENKLLNYSDLIISSPKDQIGKWRDLFIGENESEELTNSRASLGSDNRAEYEDSTESTSFRNSTLEGRLYVEIGCGKGKFVTELAELNPNDRFIAIEGFSSVIIRAVDKARKKELQNVLFVQDFVYDLGTWFSSGEIDGIYLNFSDPWPKKKNAKRRLTYRDRLEQYAKALAPGGFIRIKTDNDDFFQFTLEEVEEYNSRRKRTDGQDAFDVVAFTRDLHKSEWKDLTPMTEYETKFKGAGKNINFVEIKNGGNF